MQRARQTAFVTSSQRVLAKTSQKTLKHMVKVQPRAEAKVLHLLDVLLNALDVVESENDKFAMAQDTKARVVIQGC